MEKKQLRFIGVGMSFLICFLSGVAVTVLSGSGKVDYFVPDSEKIEIIVPLGSRTSVKLPDGSFVWLNAGSTLSYLKSFGAGPREVFLTGEAYFEIYADTLNPFRVHIPAMTIHTTGNIFNIKDYPDEEKAVMTSVDGKVDILMNDQEKGTRIIRLKPQEQLVIPRILQNSSIRRYAQINTMPVTSWKDSQWIIDSQPLSELVSPLERRYNLKISFSSDDLKNYRFSGTIENETAEQIFKALALAAPISYVFDKNKVILSLNMRDKKKYNRIVSNPKNNNEVYEVI